LACILAAAALCSGAAIEPRGDTRYDLPGSNLKEAAISHSSAEAEQVHTQPAQEALDLDRPGEMDPLLQRIRETRPAVYSAIQVWIRHVARQKCFQE